MATRFRDIRLSISLPSTYITKLAYKRKKILLSDLHVVVSVIRETDAFMMACVCVTVIHCATKLSSYKKALLITQVINCPYKWLVWLMVTPHTPTPTSILTPTLSNIK